jgi:hypothetical protein
LCVDYDIAVQGDSFNQVKAELEDAIADYVIAARDEAPADAARLLSRRAPMRVRLAWAFRVLRSAWRHGADQDTSASFPVACPA